MKPEISHSPQEGLLPLFRIPNDLQHTIVSIYSLETRQFTWFNHLTQSHLGYDPKDLARQNLSFWLSLVHVDDREKIRASFLEGKNDISDCPPHAFNKMEYRLKHKNGQWRFVWHEQKVVSLENKHVVVNLIVDLTEKEMLSGYFNLWSDNKPEEIKPKFGQLNTDLDVSCREMEVLKLIGGGLSSKEIANKLYISNHTAVSHRKNLIRKFGVRNTAQLIREASKMVLI